ncbi:MAG: glycosyltransferase [Candidatus Krumholzibacteria bacterium]|nr:glycosyltransferase [Candidatus Krumholzibacteria bacterium]
MTKPKLLLVNKFYHDKGPAGGVGRYLVQEEEDLLAAGWDVIPFAMADQHARPSPWERYFVKARDYSAARYGGGALGDAMSLIWNREAARNLDTLLTETRVDVAHLHNIYHHLSPSILPVLRRHKVPVVMTLHDLRLLCPAIHMLREGQVCEKCKGGKLHNAVLGKCVKDSRAASLLAAVETAHQRWRRMYEKTVQTFLCPSDFYRLKFIEWGFPADKLRHLPNFVDLDFWQPNQIPEQTEKDAYIYFGRISKEKGLRFLLAAQKLWEDGYADGSITEPPLKLLIAGSGPCEGNLRAKAAQLKLQTVEILGPLGIEDLRRNLGRSRFSALPSIWYENGPMAALESLAAGIPLVGSDIGGIPEMITEGETGFIFAPGNPAEILQGLLKTCRLTNAGPRARKWAEKHASRTGHMEKLAAILSAACENETDRPQ